MTTQEILHAAQGAKLPLALADADTKNAALEAMAVALIAAQDKILDANKQDVENARGRVSDVMLDRLALTPSRLTDMAKGMREVAALPDQTPVITMSMGALGAVSRLCGEAFGSAMTFANPGQASAPGQVALDVVNEVLESLRLA